MLDDINQPLDMATKLYRKLNDSSNACVDKHPYTFRYASNHDVNALLQLEKKCWQKHLRISRNEILHRIKQFPAGQLMVVMQEKIVAVIYMQTIADENEIKSATYKNITKLYDPDGNIIQLLAINVAPEVQDIGLGQQIRKFVLWLAALRGMKKVVAVTRCRNYLDYPHLSMNEYVKQHIQTPNGVDSGLRFHTSYGANIVSVIQGFREEDIDNHGAGILIEYNLSSEPSIQNKKEESLAIPESSVEHVINKLVSGLLPEDSREDFKPTLAFRDLGFDSLCLLELQTLINQYFNIKLDSTIFFECSTPIAIANYLKKQVRTVSIQESNHANSDENDLIAIIGMACRFPGEVNSTGDFWSLLTAGKNAITELPDNRKNSLGNSVSRGGFLEHVDCFDANFFRISPREAELMDPQQRILLEVTWEAIEQAGICANELKGSKTGVFVGIISHDYEALLMKNKSLKSMDAYYATGNSVSVSAGRLSYVLGLQGPAIAVNTACSSSLVAVHLACQSLHNNEADLALASGVNLILSPELNIAYRNAGMLSPDGACKTFDDAANGYVRSEGCGVIVLKKLSKAMADNDNILAIIRGSVINQDGASNGLTAPSSTAQSQLLENALKQSKITPDTVSFLEAHGTGTALGDPVEVKAITAIYGHERSDASPLYLGSVKTNIGHTEATAGIAGLIKTVLMLQHKQIVANLHFKTLNHHITNVPDFFVIPTSLIDWQQEDRLPRRAGVSSFGFSGTNAHVILEEAPVSLPQPKTSKAQYLVAISGKSAETLKQRLIDLEQWLMTEGHSKEIADISYTLNKGRCHFEMRCAILVASTDHLQQIIQKLNREGFNQSIDNVFSNLPYYQNPATNLTDRLLQNVTDYVHGKELDWAIIHANESATRLIMPSYPFAKERYWLSTEKNEQNNAYLHPLVDANISTLGNIRFSKKLSAESFYIKDHHVLDIPVLPGVTYLEMARVVGSLLLPQKTVTRLSNIVWRTPIAFEKNDYQNVMIEAISDNNVKFSVITRDESSKSTLHAEGCIEYNYSNDSIYPPINLAEIKARCINTAMHESIYTDFMQAGLNYGQSFRVMDQIWKNEHEAIAILKSSRLEEGIVSSWILHPALLDGALQAALFQIISDNPPELMIPFSVDAVEIIRKIEPDIDYYAYVEKITKDRFAVSLLDESGNICVYMKNVCFRKMQSVYAGNKIDYCPIWIEQPLDTSIKHQAGEDDVTLIVCPFNCNVLHQTFSEKYNTKKIKTVWLNQDISYTEKYFHESLSKITKISHLYFMSGILHDAEVDSIEVLKQSESSGVIALLNLFKVLIQKNLLHPGLYCKILTFDTQRVFAGESVYSYFAGLYGLAHVFANEYPAVSVTCLDIKSAELTTDINVILEAITADSVHHSCEYVALREGKRYVRALVPFQSKITDSVNFRTNGVYLIVAGASGIGFMLSKYLAKNYQAKLIWIARSSQNAYQDNIHHIEALGGEVLYCQGDIQAIETMDVAVQKAKEKFGKIHGAFHSALVLQDQAIMNMDEGTFNLSLLPKSLGSINFYRALKQEKLDFMIFFSSIQSFLAFPGQSNYAAGCTFQDAFTHSLIDKNAFPIKTINWGYWGNIGIVATPLHQARMRERGIDSIEPAEGIDAIYRMLNNSLSQLVVIKAEQSVLDKMGVVFSREIVTAEEEITSCISQVTESCKHALQQLITPDEPQAIGFDTLELSLVLFSFQRMGAFRVKNEVYDAQQLFDQLHFLPKYKSLYHAILEMLCRHEVIAMTGDCITVLPHPLIEHSIGIDALDAIKEKTINQHPHLLSNINFLWTCVQAYPDVLTGKKSHMDIMFPEGSLALVEGFYQGHPVADYYNQCVAICVVEYIRQRQKISPDAEITILELGAGTGSTTQFVIQQLAEAKLKLRYIYTDISAGFVNVGAEKWGKQYPWMLFQKIDIEKESSARDAGLFSRVDLVFATNVLHATKDIKHTLNNVKQFLKKNGLLLLNELVQYTDFTLLTFGMTDGWWLFADKNKRIPHAPLLNEKQWRNQFLIAGFNKIQRLDKQASSGQAILITESDGLLAIINNNEEQEVDSKKTEIMVIQEVNKSENLSLDALMTDYLQSVFSDVLKTNKLLLNPQHMFHQFGVDSLISLEINAKLSRTFGPLPATLLFEYSTIAKLTEYFIANHKESAGKKFLIHLSNNKHSALQQDKLSQNHQAKVKDIAIIGCAGRYPGANNINEFWTLLQEGKSAITTIPEERWHWQDHYDPMRGVQGKSYSHFGGFITDVDKFDAEFFQLSPLEAERMDPQERIFIQTAWSALEDAGITKKILDKIDHQVGVFVGVMNHDYGLLKSADQATVRSTAWSIANRVSYHLDLHGPSMAVDTACSSSLTALHLATTSLGQGECKMAVVGGVNLILHPDHYAYLCQMYMLSDGDACRAFGENADGFVVGEGVGAVILKPLEQALKDGDSIYAVIKGTATNSGGKNNGYTVPNPTAQARLISEAMLKANVEPSTISYIEAHGTGTALGDPIEVSGLTKAFSNANSEVKCAIGSVKSNIGHLESAAGIAGITKVLLQLQHKKLVPSLHAETLNHHIDFDQSMFYVQRELSDWPRVDYPRRAGISSFGAGGTNAHIVLEEAPATIEQSTYIITKPGYLVTLSAKKKELLINRARDLSAWINHPGRPKSQHYLEALAYTLNVKREHFECRVAFVVDSMTALKIELDNFIQGIPSQNYVNSENTEITISDKSEYKKKLIEFARMYVSGEEISLESLHEDELNSLLHGLPTYPFAKERHWIQNVPKTTINHVGSDQHIVVSHNTLLFDKVSTELLHIIATLLKIKKSELTLERNLSAYGIDSIHVMNLTNEINRHYQLQLTPTILFEHKTLKSFTEHLIKHFHDKLEKFYHIQPSAIAASAHQLPPITIAKYPRASDGFAIIGMHSVLPDASNPAEFWENLINGNDSIKEIPTERWDSTFSDARSKWGGFVDTIAEFDAAFFNISPREAELIDPQQRIFLQTVFSAMEDAGYSQEYFSGIKTGVFVGVVNHDYAEILSKHDVQDAYITTGLPHGIIANRVSYLFDLKGPSEAIDTACSSSIVAIHHAISAIQNGDCEVAIVGGVNALLSPNTYNAAGKAEMLSKDGRCKTFDSKANGYVRAEGAGAIIIKPLKHAERDGDHIYGIVKGTAINHGGQVTSLTVPNPLAQADTIISACHRANINVDTISFIETHGTGTSLGDPIEINGLKSAFAHLAEAQQINIKNQRYCGLGSHKTNIGHLESAAGIAGVIKVLLAMKHGMIPRNLHFDEINPFIELDDSPFYLVVKNQAWERLKDKAGQDIPRRAGVSSFGFGGVNAHMVVEEAQERTLNQQKLKSYYLITLSARQKDNLDRKIIDLRDYVVKNKLNLDLQRLSFTLNAGRSHFDWRCALVVDSIDDLIDQLENAISGSETERCLINSLPLQKVKGPLFTEIYHQAIERIKTYRTTAAQDYLHHLLIIADLYIKHYPFDLNVIHIDEDNPRLASLPTYPFSKTRYWFDASVKQHQIITTQVVTNLSLHDYAIQYLTNIFAEKAKIPVAQIDAHITYENYGIDSLLTLEITNRLEADFGTLPKTILYEKNQIHELALFMQKKYSSTLEKMRGGDLASQSPDHASVIKSDIITNDIVKSLPSHHHEDIAIIGLSGTYPMAKDMNEFWDNLISGRDCITDIPKERWNYLDYPVMIGGEKKYYQKGGFIQDVDKFDPLFFNISPRDAALMDPQERLFMQTVWATLEDAGYTRDALQATVNNKVGVFVGVTYNFYPLFIAENWKKHNENNLPLDIQTFSIANRISYFLNVNGPSFVIDTACSSSLAAIHLAYESLIRGECQMAIAGGVNLSLHPSKYHALGYYNFMSDDGQCKSFGENGSGYVPGEGVGSVLLKPLSLALRDNDRIYAVIKSSSMNHGGKTSGYTVPNPRAQAELIRSAMSKANINPRTISYIEAHGTGTSLGDPIEIRGMQEAFEEYTQDKQFCAVGSVKSNIGHLESAAGISQLTKVLLQLQHRKLVPSLHAKKLNPFIDFNETAFFVQQELKEWKVEKQQIRRAGISSFGAGGTNVHMIIDEYSAEDKIVRVSKPFIFILSANSKESLLLYAQSINEYIQRERIHYPTIDSLENWLNSVCYTLQIGREAMTARLGIIANTGQELMQSLQDFIINYNSSLNRWVNFSCEMKRIKTPIDNFIEQGQFEKIAESWVNGASISWNLLHFEGLPARLSLPTYPFAKRRCWVPEKISLVNAEDNIISIPDHLRNSLYQVRWEQHPENNIENFNAQPSHWLILASSEVGQYFNELLDNSFCMNRDADNDVDSLFALVHEKYASQLTNIILHESFFSGDSNNAFILLNVFQALIKHPWKHKLHFTLITRAGQEVCGNESVQPWQHYLWSMTRIFAKEQSNYEILLIDLDAKVELQVEARKILHEIRHYRIDEYHLAFRDHARYVTRLGYYLNASTVQYKPWRAPVAAIITGGLGALGIEVAKWLGSQGCKYLLLTGMSQLPSQGENQSEKTKALSELKRLGVTVRYQAVDVTDAARMKQVIDTAQQEWGRAITGVLHLAGMTTDSIPIANMTSDVLHKVLAVKTQGALVLHELFQQPDLDCFVLFSSISAMQYFGIHGLCAYSMANEFLNGLALTRRSQGLQAMSIDWAAWADKGMSFKYNHSAFLNAIGMSTLSIADGMEILAILLSLQPCVVSAFGIDWPRFMQMNPDANKQQFFSDFMLKEPLQQKTVVALDLSDVVSTVSLALSQLLALDLSEIDEQVSFQHYGMDSILGVEFVAILSKTYPHSISPMDLYRYPTVLQLSQYIVEVLKPACISAEEDTMQEMNHLDEDQLLKLLEDEMSDIDVINMDNLS